jgi:hypothetical protein
VAEAALLELVGVVSLVKPTLCKAVLRAVCRRLLERLIDPMENISTVFCQTLAVAVR